MAFSQAQGVLALSISTATFRQREQRAACRAAQPLRRFAPASQGCGQGLRAAGGH